MAKKKKPTDAEIADAARAYVSATANAKDGGSIEWHRQMDAWGHLHTLVTGRSPFKEVRAGKAGQ